MEFTGEFRIPATRDRVWAALNDPEILRHCIPGCEVIERHSETDWTARIRAKIGPLKARFSGRITLSELDPPDAYRIEGEACGAAAGFAKGGAAVHLVEEAGETVLAYIAEGQIKGMIARIGARLVDGAAHKLAEIFFGRFVAILNADPVDGTPVAAVADPPIPFPLPSELPPSELPQ
jgi:uncharacterized protein